MSVLSQASEEICVFQQNYRNYDIELFPVSHPERSCILEEHLLQWMSAEGFPEITWTDSYGW